MEDRLQENANRVLEFKRRFQSETSHAQLAKVLEDVIDNEMERLDVDIDNSYIDSCEELLWCIYGGKERAPKSNKKKNWNAIHKVIRAKSHNATQFPWSRVILFSIVIVVVIFAIDINLNQLTFQTTMSNDEQQYIVEASKPSLNTIPQAAASVDENQSVTFSSDSLAAISDFIGYEPILPAWIPDGWQPIPYTVHVSGNGHEFSTAYQKYDEEYLITFDYFTSNDADDLRIEFEQNQSGKRVSLENGIGVYLTENLGRYVAIWIQGNGYYSISAPISFEEIEKMILSIY